MKRWIKPYFDYINSGRLEEKRLEVWFKARLNRTHDQLDSFKESKMLNVTWRFQCGINWHSYIVQAGEENQRK